MCLLEYMDGFLYDYVPGLGMGLADSEVKRVRMSMKVVLETRKSWTTGGDDCAIGDNMSIAYSSRIQKQH